MFLLNESVKIIRRSLTSVLSIESFLLNLVMYEAKEIDRKSTGNTNKSKFT